MQSFYVTPNRYNGRVFWMANFPGPGRLNGKSEGRGQRKFVTKESAESFLQEARREWIRTGRIELAADPKVHYDLLRAVKLLVRSGVRNWSLERCAHTFLQCCSAKEIAGRDMRYQVARDRTVSLSPRMFLLVQNESTVRQVSLVEALEGMLGEIVLARVDQAIRQATCDEKRELEELECRNAVEKKRLREIEKEREIRREFGKIDMVFEAGRRSVLDKRNKYERKRYAARKREREAKERLTTQWNLKPK
jgi:hypothetical protein